MRLGPSTLATDATGETGSLTGIPTGGARTRGAAASTAAPYDCTSRPASPLRSPIGETDEIVTSRLYPKLDQLPRCHPPNATEGGREPLCGAEMLYGRNPTKIVFRGLGASGMIVGTASSESLPLPPASVRR